MLVHHLALVIVELAADEYQRGVVAVGRHEIAQRGQLIFAFAIIRHVEQQMFRRHAVGFSEIAVVAFELRQMHAVANHRHLPLDAASTTR